ncbi:MAG: Gfo/Idh/MocA family oxidoreductase [Planctomycetes bacterium]|nr:Gfo/Idh/MocA family oxidoreductase [Planctomycetota bacterium]MBL7143901.1 Gfo/Idh/MocA family oxidoreductase [Phycisphaerae bacterium]
MKHKRHEISRRAFVKSASIGIASPYIISASALGREGRPAASNRLTLGLIGLGSMGMRHVKGFLQENDCEITAVCDVDAGRLNAAAREVNKHYDSEDCARYNDFRELIARDEIDTLCISVPDHWHSIPAIEGIRAGKDIYGEKPLALTISEGRAMVEAVHRYNCVWQTGSWQRSTAHFRFGCELVRNQRIGTLQRVDVGMGGGYNPGGGKPTVDRIEPQPIMSIPEGFDYEMWLGPAPRAAYTENRCHWNFRWNMDYSGGQVTDWGGHHIDIAHWGMGCDETGPVKVAGRGIFPEDGLWDAAFDYDFECTYKNGVRMRVASNNHCLQGVRFTGDKGWVHITRSGLDANPKRLLKEKIGPEEIHLARPSGDHRQGHRRDFLDCVKTRAQTITPVEVGHRSISVAHLGNIAMIFGREIRWDPKREQIINAPEASRMLGRSMRSPWYI